MLGPASLAYLDECDFEPAELDSVDVVPGEQADLAALLASVTADDADECGLLADITSNAFMVRRGNHVIAAAGYRRWPPTYAYSLSRIIAKAGWRVRLPQ